MQPFRSFARAFICAFFTIYLLAQLVPVAAAADAARAELALSRGAWPQAAAEYAAAARAAADPELAERATRVAFDNFQYGAAVVAARRWAELAPAQEVPRRFLAAALLRSGQVDGAVAQFRVLLDTAYPDPAHAYLALLDNLLAEPDENAAARVIESLARGDETVAEAWYARSVLWQRADAGERALLAAREALRLRQGWGLAQLAEARALLTLDREDEALAVARQLAESGDPLMRLNHAWFLFGAERPAEARAEFEAVLAVRAGAPEALEGLGVIDYEQKDYDRAMGRFGEMLRSARASDTGFWYIGLIAEKQDDKRLAARSLARVTGGSRAVAAQVRAQRLLADAGSVTEAQALLDDFLAAYPEQGPLLAGAQAAALSERGRGADALRILERARGLYPDDVGLGMTAAAVLERMDRVDDALGLLRRLLRERPDDPMLQNSLGYTLVDRSSKLAEGEALIARALAQKPDNYAVMDSMGWALVRRGRSSEGLPYLERAWHNSKDAEVALHLGDAYRSVGRPDDARAVLEAALAADPDGPQARRLRERLGP